MSLIAVGTPFPALPLALVALNFRYTSLAGLMRQITSQLEASTQDGPGEAVLIDELTVMKKRMTLVKYALFLCGVAFIFNLAALYLGYFSPGGLEPAIMALTILSMVGGISCFCVETVLSTKALNLHISGVLHRDATGPDGRAKCGRHQLRGKASERSRSVLCPAPEAQLQEGHARRHTGPDSECKEQRSGANHAAKQPSDDHHAHLDGAAHMGDGKTGHPL